MLRRGKNCRELRRTLTERTVYVLGNGPSIVSHDLSRLRGRPVIGMNASPLLEAQYGFKAGYYVLSDARFLSHPDKGPIATGMASDVVRILREELIAYDDPQWIPKTFYVRTLGKNGFSHDLRRGYYFGCTTTMLAIQFAAYAGAKRIVLLGTDFRYPKDKPRFYPESSPQPEDPFLSIQLWNIRNAFLELRIRGTDLVICTTETNLRPYIPYLDFNETFEN